MRRWVALRLVGAGVVAALLLATPAAVHAHEKWFTDARPYPVRLELLISLPVALAVLASAGAVGLLLLARRVVGGDNLFPRVGFLRRFDPEARVVMAIQTAITLIYLAVNLRLLARFRRRFRDHNYAFINFERLSPDVCPWSRCLDRETPPCSASCM